MTDLDALYAAVLAAPDDDLPRLVYADAIEEAGEGERAEFIRVQCRLAELKPPVDVGEVDQGSEQPMIFKRLWPLFMTPRQARGLVVGSWITGELRVSEHGRFKIGGKIERIKWWVERSHVEVVIDVYPTHPHADKIAKLHKRELELLRLAPEWALGVCFDKWYQSNDAAWEDATKARITWCRGFIESITCPWDACAEHLDTIRERHPIRRVTLTTQPVFTWMLTISPSGQDLVEVAGERILVKSGATLVEMLALRWQGIEFVIDDQQWQGIELMNAETIPGVINSPPTVSWNEQSLSPLEAAIRQARDMVMTATLSPPVTSSTPPEHPDPSVPSSRP